MVSAPRTLAHLEWPPNYVNVFQWRQEQVLKLRKDPMLRFGAMEYYRTHPCEFINHWVDTYDPRNAGRGTPSRIPLICFERQDDLVNFLMGCIKDEEGGLIEKARDMGASWVCCGFSVWLFLFWPGASVGWGSRKEQLVDRIGDTDSLFEKMRMIIRGLPVFFLPKGFSEKDHMTYMKFINPETGSSITGEAGDNIGRGGRKLIYFKDESAHYERPEKIEAALADNTRVPIDISSVNGLGNVFHRRRENGQEWHPKREMEKGRTRVFVMDWRDHPAKTQEWYDQRKKKAEADGLLHVFAQEVDRNYSASVEGVVIPSEWIDACIDSHIALGIKITGGHAAALDVADGGIDKNALSVRQGILLKVCEDWGSRDTAVAARKAITLCEPYLPLILEYDSIGVGAGVKAEINNQRDDDKVPIGMDFNPWNAALPPLLPEQRLNDDDEDSPRNEDYFASIKSQGWWELRMRCYRTYMMVMGLATYAHDTLISIPSSLPQIHQIKKEMAQATMSQSTKTQKMVVDKSPEGTKSPNLADSIVMCFWPAEEQKSFGMLAKSRHR